MKRISFNTDTHKKNRSGREEGRRSRQLCWLTISFLFSYHYRPQIAWAGLAFFGPSNRIQRKEMRTMKRKKHYYIHKKRKGVIDGFCIYDIRKKYKSSKLSNL
jgi:hypothetical protein